MPYPISIRVRLRVRNRTFDGRTPEPSANSHSSRVTEETIGLLCHELAKLSSLFSAFRKCLKLQNWYQNVLFCL